MKQLTSGIMGLMLATTIQTTTIVTSTNALEVADNCLVGSWIMETSQFENLTDILLEDLGGELSWQSGKSNLHLSADGTYKSSLHNINAVMGAGSEGVQVVVTGTSSGTFKTQSGKLALKETENTLTMKMKIPGTNQEMIMPLGEKAKTDTSFIHYSCSNAKLVLNVEFDVPDQGLKQISFELNRA